MLSIYKNLGIHFHSYLSFRQNLNFIIKNIGYYYKNIKIAISIIKPTFIIIGILSFCFKWFSVSAFIFSFSFDFIGGGKVFELLGTESAYFGIGGVIYLIGFIVGIDYLSDDRIGYTSISLNKTIEIMNRFVNYRKKGLNKIIKLLLKKLEIN